MTPKSKFFNLIDTGLSGTKAPTLIRSHLFINEAQMVLSGMAKTSLPEAIHEYGEILRYLVKQELLAEMRKSIENIDTFYR